MEKEYSITIKVVNISESGEKTKWTVKVSSITQITKWPMMVSGKKISFRVMVHYIMKKLAH